jgi:hypothetical protein
MMIENSLPDSSGPTGYRKEEERLPLSPGVTVPAASLYG